VSLVDPQSRTSAKLRLAKTRNVNVFIDYSFGCSLVIFRPSDNLLLTALTDDPGMVLKPKVQCQLTGFAALAARAKVTKDLPA
jgi:hypothetical protein